MMLLAAVAPLVVVVQSTRGEVRIPVRLDPIAGPVLAAPLLLPVLDAKASIGDGWAEVAIASKSFRFYFGAPFFTADGSVFPLVGSASVRRDTLQLPLQFVSEILPHAFAGRFRYDPRLARLADGAPPPVVANAKAAPKDPDRLP